MNRARQARERKNEALVRPQGVPWSESWLDHHGFNVAWLDPDDNHADLIAAHGYRTGGENIRIIGDCETHNVDRGYTQPEAHRVAARALDVLNDPIMWRAVVVSCSDAPSEFEVLLVNVYVHRDW